MLTEKQQRILDAILEYTAKQGFAPSLREIGDIVGLKSTATVYGWLHMQAGKGGSDTQGTWQPEGN